MDMPKKTFVTRMPDQSGAFLRASEIISRHAGNITRVSYNKAVDLHMLFIDVEAQPSQLAQITVELGRIGYLNDHIAPTRVLVVVIRVPDRAGSMLPVLQILSRYDVNISYMNSASTGAPVQDFKMGLLIENPDLIRRLLDEISRLYPIDIVDYDDIGENLDNTVFYIRLASEMRQLLRLSTEQTMEFISESNRIMQTLEEKGENPYKVFEYIRQFAQFISRQRDSAFHADIEVLPVGGVTLYSIQPPCGSNIYVMDTGGELVLVDTGYAIYAREMLAIFRRLFPGWDSRPKRIFITHADVDHCGLLAVLSGARILLNQKSADGLRLQREGLPDYREHNVLGLGYSRLSRIISGYIPPDPARFELIDAGTPAQHDDLLPIGRFSVGDLNFEVYEGSGGHLYGEMMFLCREQGLAFTGDILVNISGFTPERARFNSLAPYLMRSVNVDSGRATEMRRRITGQIEEISAHSGRPCVVCGGHGPVSVLENGHLVHAGGLIRRMALSGSGREEEPHA